jgi:hypothetical protein
MANTILDGEELAIVILQLKDAETGQDVTGASVNFVNAFEN